jgi:hypothetical protein
MGNPGPPAEFASLGLDPADLVFYSLTATGRRLLDTLLESEAIAR